MGPITDRTKEFLGTSDRAIILMRRLLLENIAAVERGDEPLGLDPRESEDIRGCDGFLPASEDWKTAFATERKAKW